MVWEILNWYMVWAPYDRIHRLYTYTIGFPPQWVGLSEKVQEQSSEVQLRDCEDESKVEEDVQMPEVVSEDCPTVVGTDVPKWIQHEDPTQGRLRIRQRGAGRNCQGEYFWCNALLYWQWKALMLQVAVLLCGSASSLCWAVQSCSEVGTTMSPQQGMLSTRRLCAESSRGSLGLVCYGISWSTEYCNCCPVSKVCRQQDHWLICRRILSGRGGTVNEPFQWIAMDIAGRLSGMKSGNWYISVMCLCDSLCRGQCTEKHLSCSHSWRVRRLFSRMGIAKGIGWRANISYPAAEGAISDDIFRQIHTSRYHFQTERIRGMLL